MIKNIIIGDRPPLRLARLLHLSIVLARRLPHHLHIHSLHNLLRILRHKRNSNLVCDLAKCLVDQILDIGGKREVFDLLSRRTKKNIKLFLFLCI